MIWTESENCITCTRFNKHNSFCDYYKKNKQYDHFCNHYDRLILNPNIIQDDKEYFFEEYNETNIDNIIERYIKGDL